MIRVTCRHLLREGPAGRIEGHLPDLGEEGSGQLLLAELVPVHVLEPAVVLDIVSSVLEAAVSEGNIGHEQVLDEGLGIPARYL